MSLRTCQARWRRGTTQWMPAPETRLRRAQTREHFRESPLPDTLASTCRATQALLRRRLLLLLASAYVLVAARLVEFLFGERARTPSRFATNAGAVTVTVMRTCASGTMPERHHPLV
jgi:hypothetical protein